MRSVLVNDINAVVNVGLQEDDSIGPGQVSSLGYSPPVSFVARDFDGDGIVDVVTAGAGNERGGQMLFLRGLGAGRFADPVVYAIDPNYSAGKVVAADWNGDGYLDIVLAATRTYVDDRIYIFLNDGHGKFSLAQNTPFSVSPAGSASGTMEVADVLPASPGLEIVIAQDGNYNPYGGIYIEGKIQIVGKDPFLGYNRLMTISLGQDLAPTDFRFGDFNEDGRTDILINGTT